jgi:chemotaxis signal transduction protein
MDGDKMDGDKIVIELEGFAIAIDTAIVMGIKEVDKLPFVPGQKGLVCGIISMRNEPVTVVNIHRAFGITSQEDAGGGQRKVVIVKEKGRMLGIDIGNCRVSFLWHEDIKGKTSPHEGKYIKGRIEGDNGPIRLIDPWALFDEAAKLLSSKGTSA